jgi:DNA-binding CsgD family transcriptional regulator
MIRRDTWRLDTIRDTAHRLAVAETILGDMRGVKRGATIHHIRHIAGLGLGDRLAIPLMIEAVGHILPAAFVNFLWLDEQEQPEGMFLPVDVPAPLELYLSPSEQFDEAAEPTVSNVVAMRQTVGANASWNQRPDFHRSVLYNEVCRPYGIGAGLDMVVRINGRARGIMFVNREPRPSLHFAPSERALMASLEPYFRHAMKAVDSDDRVDSDVADFGVMTIDANGAVLFATENVPRLLRQFDPALDWQRPHDLPSDMPLEILMLVRRVIASERHIAAPPPSLTRVTPWGTIEVRTYADIGHGNGASGARQFGVTIERRVPRTVRILRRLRSLDLSPRQREIAFELASGSDRREICARMSLTETTWRDYLKRIYERTEVHSRAEFNALFD